MSTILGELIYGSDTEVLVLKGTDFNLTCQATIIEVNSWFFCITQEVFNYFLQYFSFNN